VVDGHIAVGTVVASEMNGKYTTVAGSEEVA
jgi:hypothetical protein